MSKKSVLEKELPGKMIELNGKEYEVTRLTKKGLFQLARFVGKLQAVVDLSKFSELIAKESEENIAIYLVERLLAGLPFCEDEFTVLMIYVLKDKEGVPPTKEQIDDMDVDTLETIIKTFISQQDMGDLFKRFFTIMTTTLASMK